MTKNSPDEKKNMKKVGWHHWGTTSRSEWL